MKYWNIDPVTREVLSPVTADKWNTPRNVLLIEPLPLKDGFIIVANEDLSGSEYIEDHRGETVYLKSDGTKNNVIRELGPIDNDWTPKKPATEWDEWFADDWVTNESDQYIGKLNQVDAMRRALYAQMVGPLMDEARMKRDVIKTPEAIAEADELEQQALAARLKIQTANPWPVPPSN